MSVHLEWSAYRAKHCRSLFIGGGYSSPKCGTNVDLCDQLREPYGERGHIFFAGEATTLPGATAHAAMASGIRAASQVASYLSSIQH